MTTLPIIVYGNGDLFRQYFNAIVALFGTSDFKRLLHISILLGGVTVMFSYTMKRDLMVILQWFGVFYLAIYVLFMPQATVKITDRVNSDKSYFVDHVPLGLAVLASYTSVIGDALTKNIESNFTMPDYMPYNRTGMVFASQLVTAASQFEVTDAKFDENLREFVHQCVFYDLLLNKYSMDELTSTKDIWSLVSNNASPARAFVYNGDITTCQQGVQQLTTDWTKLIDSALTQYGQRIYPNLEKSMAKTKIVVDLPMSYSYLTQLSESASEIMQQNLMANAIQRGIVSMNAKLNANAALESYAFTRAQEQKRLTNKTLGDMAAYWLPLMKNAFEAIMYGSFIFIVLLSVFPFGGTIVKKYVYTLVWLQVWAPLYAIINLMVCYYAQSHSSAAASGALSLKAMSGILQINSDVSGLAGYLTLSVPFLSYGLVTGMAGTFTQLAQFVGGVTQSAGGAGASEAVTGNMSFGNTSMNNHNDFNTSSNHLDTSGRASSGMLTTQTTGGSLLTKMSDGSVVMDMKNAISSLGTSVNFAESERASYSAVAERATTAAKNYNHTYGDSLSSALRDANQLSDYLGKSTGSSEGWSVGVNSDVAKALHGNQSIIQDYATKHGISNSDSANVLANAYVDSKLSVSTGFDSGSTLGGKALELATGWKGVSATASGSGGYSRTAGHTSSVSNAHDYSDAKSYVANSGYSNNVSVIERAAHDHSLKMSSDKGGRLSSDMSASFDKAESARNDMQSSYNIAQSAREHASYAVEQADSINMNGGQKLKEWIMNQPGTNGKGRMGYDGAEAILKDPEATKPYASRFMEQYKHEIESNYQSMSQAHHLTSTQSGIHHQYEANNHQIKGNSAVQSAYASDQSRITQSAEATGLRQENLIDYSIKDKTEHQIANNRQQVNVGENIVHQKGSAEIDKVHAEAAHKRNGGLTHDLASDVDTKN
jgi:conjugal transfer mating pair stabilization protein TraG